MSASNEKVNLQKSLFQPVNKVRREKKSSIDLQDFYQDWLALFNVHRYDEFHVPDVLIVLLYV